MTRSSGRAAKAADGKKIRWGASPVRVQVPPPAPFFLRVFRDRSILARSCERRTRTTSALAQDAAFKAHLIYGWCNSTQTVHYQVCLFVCHFIRTSHGLKLIPLFSRLFPAPPRCSVVHRNKRCSDDRKKARQRGDEACPPTTSFHYFPAQAVPYSRAFGERKEGFPRLGSARSCGHVRRRSIHGISHQGGKK
jgi:hypothetical protein